jgi:glycosyltransferase involved in cell wall biosynthesis
LNKNKKDIVFFCPAIGDGGLEKTLSIYLNYLSKFNNIILVTNTKNIKRLSSIDKKTKIINHRNNFFLKYRLLNNLYCIFLLLKIVNSRSIIFSMQDHFLLLLLKFFGLKNKLAIRTMSAIYNNKNTSESLQLKKHFFLKKFIMNFYKYADLVITFSANNKFYLKRVNNVKNVQVIYNYFKKYNGKKKIKKTYNIFFIGRLVDDKDPIFFLKNCIALTKSYNIKIHIIGKGDNFLTLKKMSKKNYNDIKVHGFYESPLKKFNKIIDLLCVTSKYDGTPNILGEAMSYKIPVLAPNKVGLSNLLLSNGKFGYLYKPGNGASFRENIINIITNYGQAITKAKKGYEGLDRFDKKNTLFKLNKMINDISLR